MLRKCAKGNRLQPQLDREFAQPLLILRQQTPAQCDPQTRPEERKERERPYTLAKGHKHFADAPKKPDATCASDQRAHETMPERGNAVGPIELGNRQQRREHYGSGNGDGHSRRAHHLF